MDYETSHSLLVHHAHMQALWPRHVSAFCTADNFPIVCESGKDYHYELHAGEHEKILVEYRKHMSKGACLRLIHMLVSLKHLWSEDLKRFELAMAKFFPRKSELPSGSRDDVTLENVLAEWPYLTQRALCKVANVTLAQCNESINLLQRLGLVESGPSISGKVRKLTATDKADDFITRMAEDVHGLSCKAAGLGKRDDDPSANRNEA
jgi:hypothetical protein